MRRAVNAVRDAENSAKPPRLLALERTPCEGPDVCELKRTCSSAYRSHVAAYDLYLGVRRAADDETPDASSAALLDALAEAERKLRGAQAVAKRCLELEGELARRHRL